MGCLQYIFFQTSGILWQVVRYMELLTGQKQRTVTQYHLLTYRRHVPVTRSAQDQQARQD